MASIQAEAVETRSPAARAASIMEVVSKRAYPLSDYLARRRDAPEWFSRAVSRRPRRRRVEVDGAGIELLTWGRAKAPGLLFLHGSGGNAGWWSFIAPFFADNYRCAAISWSGMGGSDHRPAYSAEQYAREVSAAIDAAGFAGGSQGVIVIAHSFGGYPALIAGSNDPRIAGIALIDTLILPMALGDRPQLPPEREHPIFSTLPEALSRFRLIPVNDVDNDFVVDWIARQSLRRVRGGWSWRSDPSLMTKMTRFDLAGHLPLETCRLAYLRGEISALVEAYEEPELRALLGNDAPLVTVPGAGHQVLIDQPLALVDALAKFLAQWPG